MFPGITFRKYISSMEESYKENLSDELMEKIHTIGLSRILIQAMTRTIETQLTALTTLEKEVNIRLR
ncbi:MAG: hypothetical protein H7Y07_09800 [Pyrinomonadaceae bacterium]|nr:hypothetical protein [Sphingobacteriaceae bacterium]